MHEVAELVKQEFGKKADPVYERLIKFVEDYGGDNSLCC